jgi:hypothetical protein
MVFSHEGQEFLTDNDLKVTILGKYPSILIQNEELRRAFLEAHKRDYIGGDEIIAFRQKLVAKGMGFEGLEEELLSIVSANHMDGLDEQVFSKHTSGIARGHSLGGLSGVVLGVTGTKMIDSGLTGLVSSRSLVTSGRRRSVNESDIVVPESISQRPELLAEYLTITKEVFAEAGMFKERFGKMGGVESFNKALPYNNPAELFIVLPLDTMATLAFEVRSDELNPRGPFLPRELHALAGMFPEIANEVGIGSMYRQRINVPRGTYLHYNVFKDPSAPNLALDLALERGMPKYPKVVHSHLINTPGFVNGLKSLGETYELARRAKDPQELAEAAMRAMLATQEFCGEYNQAARAMVIDRLSFRVWSEQKRHATLRQHVESIYSAADRSVEILKPLWDQIQAAYNQTGSGELDVEKLEEAIVIGGRLRKHPELLVPYAYHTARQLMFYDRMKREGIPLRDAAFMIPRNTPTRNLEDYDLKNLIDLELPLRTCLACEPERHRTSWRKRTVIAKALPELDYFLQPKCSVGICTEAKFCGHILPIRGKDSYDQPLHTASQASLLDRAKEYES